MTPPPAQTPTGPALHQQLQATAQVIQAVLAGKALDVALLHCDKPLRSGVQALSNAVLRNLGLARTLYASLLTRKPNTEVEALLLTALALISAETAFYEPHTLVNQTVTAAKAKPRIRHAAGLINACLRRYLRETPVLLAQARLQECAAYQHPAWWIDLVRLQYPKAWQSILQANLTAAAMHLRVNTALTTVEEYQAELAKAGMLSTRIGEVGLKLAQAVSVTQLPRFTQGFCSVQDASAQLAAPLLLRACSLKEDPRSLRILDACAAPGGKTMHLLEYAAAHKMSIAVTAIEKDAVRAERISENLQRVQLAAKIGIADAANIDSWWDGVPVDAILLDAPCSASGIVRRHPDILYLRRESDILGLQKQQRTLLNALWPTLAVGGVLLYCTCSVFTEEGEEQIQMFIKNNKDVARLPCLGEILPGIVGEKDDMLDNWSDDHDGFYYALLQKTQHA